MFRRPQMVFIAAAFLALAAGGDESTDPTSNEYRAALDQRLDREIAALTEQITEAPSKVALYSARGDKRFFRGQFALAVADFEQMVKLDPDLEASHWRKGIAYFFAERFGDAARQFENYHTFDNVDRENGIWRYLSQARSSGRDVARKGLLKYAKDDREPFPDVYRLFAGEITPDELLERIAKAEITKDEREKRLFYAELYIGLNEVVEKRAASAEAHLKEAVGNRWGEKAGGGPGWMWHVGRIQYNLLRDARAAKEQPAQK